jgi:hypothetical protein
MAINISAEDFEGPKRFVFVSVIELSLRSKLGPVRFGS